MGQVTELTGDLIKKATVYKCYKIKRDIPSIDIVMPKVNKKEDYFMKKKREVRHGFRAGIEVLI